MHDFLPEISGNERYGVVDCIERMGNSCIEGMG